jgi:hypothetical protein
VTLATAWVASITTPRGPSGVVELTTVVVVGTTRPRG